jgi:hypothetical protein
MGADCQHRAWSMAFEIVDINTTCVVEILSSYDDTLSFIIVDVNFNGDY